MDTTRTSEDQSARWNGPSGQVWTEFQAMMDEMFRDFEEILVEAAGPWGRVLDVGCGTGGTTVAIARRLGEKGHCTGVDISGPMVEAARARAEREHVRAEFVQADAQDHAFEPASFDTIVSRFGVMFFGDSVRAFTNLRHAAKDGARLRLIVWRGAEDNPFMTTAERAAAPLLPGIPARVPDAPGQFGFANRDRVHRILEESGWSGIGIQPIDVTCAFPESELTGYFTRFGPLGQVLPDADERTREQVVEAVRGAFAPYVRGTEVRFTAACWLVDARRNG
ncbi:class I SAM-dependent methyltransferase [Actinocorallia populi]|uniref:class I SAM-dependent methyltransferase n=1 Tax=Actinocorallia populi TaxID=2079200 RepID=UPI0018E574D0|nr:class I SAM-dependent methyltransferase [Actinocorallia populi]